MPVTVGIDLGTTHSLCAVFRDGRPELIPNAHGETLTPSVVGVLDDGRVLVGAAARELRITQPERTVSTFKRHMGTDRTFKVAGKTFNPPELSSLVLKSLKEDAEAYLKETVQDAVITVPAYFNDHQRKATKLAGELAGLKVRRIINEPTAAALTYGFHDRDAEKHLIVIDLGGGTFDVTLMEIFEGTLEIISTAGESFLGGEDFTDRIAGWILTQEGKQLETAELKVPLQVARLRQECESAKRKLFAEDAARIRVPNEQGEFPDGAKKYKLTRDAFAKLVAPLIKRLQGPVGKALRDGDVSPEGIGDVILVGGATRMPVLRRYVQEFFEKEPLCTHNPDEVVALGAAIQAALIEDDRAVDDMVMTDVCPYTLGVRASKEFGRRMVDGYFIPIIHRNTTIPVSREEEFSTVVPNQPEVVIAVYQGEHRKADDNLPLGELRIKGLPPLPKNTPINVRFTYDVNGILEVEAHLPQTGKKYRTVITQHARGLSEDEVAAAVAKLQDLKFYPRDDLQNQRLVLFCERIIAEVSPYEREELEQAVDQFETAMESGDRGYFQSVRQGLLVMLSRMGYQFDEPDNASA